jgi:hypothetical protein
MIRRGREFGRRYADARHGFAPIVDATMRVVTISDAESHRRAYLDLLAGHTDLSVAHVVALG